MDLSYSSDGFASYYERWKLRNKDVIIIRWEEKKMGVEIHILITIIDMCIILSSVITAFCIQVDALKVNRNEKSYTKS